MIFVLEYKTRRTTFSNNIFSFIHVQQLLFSKNVPYFYRLCLKLSYMIQTNSFRMFIRVQKYIEFHLPPYEIPQPCSH